MKRTASVWAIIVALALASCATPTPPIGETSAVRTPARGQAIDRSLEARILALDPERLSGDGVRTLAQGPAPRIILLHGGIYPVHLLMELFGRFLKGMGYP